MNNNVDVAIIGLYVEKHGGGHDRRIIGAYDVIIVRCAELSKRRHTMNLSEQRDRVLTLPALEKRKSLLQKEIRETELNISGLMQKYKSESRDVERLTEKSLSGFLLKLVGKYEDRLDKEQREEIGAKLEYDRATARLEELIQERDELDSRISALRAEEKIYNAELQKRREQLLQHLTGAEGIRLTELENEREAIVSAITEIREAKGAASRAESTARSALDALKSAGNWATYDVIAGDGIISHMAKYNHIDNAERIIYSLSSQLRTLKSELADVSGIAVTGLNEISSSQRAVDFWFDNIFTDLSVRGKIQNNAGEVQRVYYSIRTVANRLDVKLDSEYKKLEENKRQEELLLISLENGE